MVIFGFWIAAMALTLIALALLLPPLLRTHRHGPDRRAIERELATLKRRADSGDIDADTYGRERARLSDALADAIETTTPVPARTLAATLAIALPAAALGLYFGLGRPDALDMPAATASDVTPQDMGNAVASLEARLREQPDDVPGWLLLARSYRAMERFDDALRATSSAFALTPESPDVMAEHAETLTLNTSTRRFDGQARQLLDEALAIDPNHQKTLWLIGIAELQAERYPEAVTYWQRLRALLPDGSSVAAGIDQQIAAAQARAAGTQGMPAMSPAGNAAPAPSEPAANAVSGPQILVTVAIAPELEDRMAASDTLFVFVRSPVGGPPLAIRRIDGPTLPASITLTQADRMLEGMQIETGADVSVGARLSKSGQAQAQPGDLQASPSTLTLGASNTMELVIDSIVE